MMAKKIKKTMAMVLALCICFSALPLQALAAEGDGTVEETVDGVKITTTTNTGDPVTDESGKTTITVTVEKVSEGTRESDGAQVEGTQTNTVVKDAERDKTIIEVEDGNEKTSWTEEDTGDGEQTKVEAELIPGETTEGVVETEKVEGEINSEEGQTTTTVTDRTLTTETSEETVITDKVSAEMEGLKSELKFDPTNSADQAAKKKETELYTDTGHFTDPDSVTVTDAPEDYPYEFVGNGDYSGHYVSHILVIYERDENGNPIKDENGEYVIKELQHASNGDVLTNGGVPTTDLNGPFDQATGTRPQQFLLKNENGDYVYGYCIDLETGAEKNKYYQVANLEDNNYYATEEAENHVRNIVTNGYWGTAEGTGSMDKIKNDLKAAVAAGTVEKEYDITFVDRFEYKKGYELKEGEYLATNKGKTYVCKQITEHVVLTDEVIDSFTNGEALDATQAAIWSFANGSRLTQDGTDGVIVGDITYASSKMGDSLNGQNDFAGAARTLAFYNYLVSLDEKQESTVVINDKNNVEDMNLSVGNKVENHESNKDNNVNNDVYEAEINFTLAFVPDPTSDDLLVHVTYVQNGEEITVVRRLAGENTEERNAETITPDANGVYTLSGLQLTENEELKFDLRLEGMQYLENGVYIYTAEGGIGTSQTMVGMGEGENTVDVTKSVTIKFDVDENNHVVAERKWHTEKPAKNPPANPNNPPEGPNNPPEEPQLFNLNREDGVVIIDEQVPLAAAPKTGDNSFLFIALALFAAISLCAANFDKKRKHEAF